MRFYFSYLDVVKIIYSVYINIIYIYAVYKNTYFLTPQKQIFFFGVIIWNLGKYLSGRMCIKSQGGRCRIMKMVLKLN